MRNVLRSVSLVLALAPVTSCVFGFDIEIDSPLLGAFVDSDGVEVTGHTNLAGQPVVVTVNGTQVPMAADGSFSTHVAFAPDATFQPLVAEVRYAGFLLDRDVVTVVRGVGVAEDAFAPDALGVRLTEPGFAAAAPGLAAALPVDLATLVPPGTVMFDDYCVVNGVLVCLAKVDIVISGTPPPSFGSLEVAIDPHQDFATIQTTVHDLFVRADVLDSLTHLKLCSVNFRAGSAPISADLALQPDPADHSRIDANLLAARVGFMDFATQNDCTLGPVFDLLLPILVGDVEDLAVQGFENFLKDPDGPGPQDSVLADLVEQAFGQLDLAAAFGQALGAQVAAAFTAVDEDEQGLTLDLDTQLRPLTQAPGAVDLSASLLVPGAVPAFGALTPSGQDYDLGLCLSSTLLNQILKLQIEGGLLVEDLTQIQVFGGTANLTAGLVSLLLPSFSRFPQPTPVTIRVRPQLAPVLDGRPGPAGELANVELAQLRVEFVVGDEVQLAMAVFARVGLDLVESEGALETRVSAPAAANVRVLVLENPIGESEDRIQTFTPSLISFFFPTLAGKAATRIELPQLLGLSIDPKEVSLSGSCIAVYGDFVASS